MKCCMNCNNHEEEIIENEYYIKIWCSLDNKKCKIKDKLIIQQSYKDCGYWVEIKN